jgi:hypothetical protein
MDTREECKYENNEDEIMDVGNEAINNYCENCLRTQNQFLTNIHGGIYKLEFVMRSSDVIKRRKKFKIVKSSTADVKEVLLCKECDNYLVNDIDKKIAKSSVNTWPSFICAVLLNPQVIENCGNAVWKMIPNVWRHWWLDKISKYVPEYHEITMDQPPSIIIDRTIEMNNWNSDIQSQKLPNLAKCCNESMMPTVLCPWGCTEYIHSCGFMPLDIIFQQFLPKVNIDLITKSDGAMNLIKYCRDDYIRFHDDYDTLLLNDDDWKVLPSINYVINKGMQFMVCKDHNEGSKFAYVHPPRQPNHIFPCKYADQICHAVIKPRTITQMKAQKYSNCFQMMEQRGNFNGIDTCNVTQYRDFTLLSVLLEEYESRSIYRRADINALLDQFVNEKLISHETAAAYRETAKEKAKEFDDGKLCYGATYVPAVIAITMQKENQPVKVIWDMREDRTEETKLIKPQFPHYLYPIQKCHKYGATPPMIPKFTNKEKKSSMIWSLTGILSHIEEIWSIVTNIELRQSQWNGWLLTYIGHTCLKHHISRASRKDPFKMSLVQSVSKVMEKIVSGYILYLY